MDFQYIQLGIGKIQHDLQLDIELHFHKSQDMDLCIYYLCKQDLMGNLDLLYILVGNLEVIQCKIINMNMMDYYQKKCIENLVHTVKERTGL